MKSLAGKLLVATPQLGDQNFHRTVIYVCAHTGEGALGVVLNRPTSVPVAEVMMRWADAISEPSEFFEGGPVGEDSAIGLAVAESGLPPGSAMPVEGRVVTLDLDADPDLVQGRLVGLRIFLGYSGWSSGQLENEIAQNSWFVLDAREDDILTTDPVELWDRVLERQSGLLSAVPMIPDDPELN